MTRLTLIVLLFSACRKDAPDQFPQPSQNTKSPAMRYSGPDYSQHISSDTAELMISSYLQSVGYPQSTTAIRSLVFNADSMRAFLSNGNIATLKFSLAHRPSYLATNYGYPAGSSAEALTFLLSGLDEEDDDYIYRNDTLVYDLSNSQTVGRTMGNTMISSYLTSINYQSNNVDLRSLTFDADTMRSFLQNSGIVKLQFAIAHRDDYILSNYGVNCGLASYGFTFVIFGLDSDDGIVYAQTDKVLEHTRPCPSFCSSSVMLTE